MAGIENDAEERVAQVAIDDLVEDAAGLADVQRAIPFRDGLEVRPDKSIDVIADRAGQPGRVLDHEPGPAVERTPDAEGHGEPVAALDPSVAGAEQPERRPGPT